MFLFGRPTLALIISVALALLIGTTFHEFMHNYVAWLMGDSTPQHQKRLTLNPAVHIYWPGFLLFLIVGFPAMPLGYATISPAGMNYPRLSFGYRLTRFQRYALAVLAGPVGSLLVAVVFALPYRLLEATAPRLLDANLIPGNPTIFPSLGDVLFMIVFWNVLLGLFNLIPLGPLDGRTVLKLFLPDYQHYPYDRFQDQYGMYILLGLIFIGYFIPFLDIFGFLIGGPTRTLTRILLGF